MQMKNLGFKKPSEMLPSVFLSHDWGENGEDHDKAKILAKKLEEFGLHVWIDEGNMQPGDALLTEISEAIQQSICVLIVVTKGYQEKVNQKSFNYCRYEFKNTIEHFQGKIIPIITDARMLKLSWPYPFGYLQSILFEDFSDISLYSGPSQDLNHPLHLKCSRLAHRILSNEPLDPALKPLTIDDIGYDGTNVCNQNHRLVYYDPNQNCLLCLYCHGNYHQPHQNNCCCQKIAAAKGEFESKFPSLRMETFSFMEKIKKSRIEIETLLRSLEAEKCESLSRLSNNFDKMRSLLSLREKQLKDAVHLLCESKTKVLSMQKKSLDDLHGNLGKEIEHTEKTQNQSEELFILSFLALRRSMTNLEDPSVEEMLAPRTDANLNLLCAENSLEKMVSACITNCITAFTPEQENRFKYLSTTLKQVLKVHSIQFDCFHPQMASLFSEEFFTSDQFVEIFYGNYLEDLTLLFQSISNDPISMIIFRNSFYSRKIRFVPRPHPLVLVREANQRQKELYWEDGSLIVTFPFPNIDQRLTFTEIAGSLQLPPVWSSLSSPTVISDQTVFQKCSMDHLTEYTLSFWLKFDIEIREERSCFLQSEDSWRYLQTGKRIIYMGLRGGERTSELVFFDAIHSESRNYHYRNHRFIIDGIKLSNRKEWVHVAITRDGEEYSFYLNGEKVTFSLEEFLIEDDLKFKVPQDKHNQLTMMKLTLIRASCNFEIVKELYRLGL